MINNVAFSGREAMLTAPAKAIASKTHEYVSAGKIFPNNEIILKLAKGNNVAKSNNSVAAIYTSPFAPTGNIKQEAPAVKHIDFFG